MVHKVKELVALKMCSLNLNKSTDDRFNITVMCLFGQQGHKTLQKVWRRYK